MTRIALLRCGKLPSFVTWDVPNLDELFEVELIEPIFSFNLVPAGIDRLVAATRLKLESSKASG